MAKILFLPGAGASPDFWKPAGALLPADWPKEYFGWPGLGDQPRDPAVRSIDDLVRMVAAKMDGPVDLVAQSMGGGIAARLAIEQPHNVRRLVLSVTSAGVDMAGLGASDWRESYRKSFPHAMPWITEPRAAALLPVEKIAAPTLLLWGDSDPISPTTVARHLQSRLQNSHLHIVAGGDHDLARTHAAEVAPLIARHLAG
jgi:pimeloyl-ACP methyl ester carboxylesterase